MSEEDFRRVLLEAVGVDQRRREERQKRRMKEERRREQASRRAAEEEYRRRRDEDARLWHRMEKERLEREQAKRIAEAFAAAQVKYQQDEYTAFMTRYSLLHELHSRLGGGPRVREAMQKHGFTDGVFIHFSFTQEEKDNIGLLPMNHIRTLCEWGIWPYRPDPLVEMTYALRSLNNIGTSHT